MSTTRSVPSGLRHDEILVSGGVLPAELAYPALLEALGDEVVAVSKDLEVYAGDEPPPNYTLGTEVEGVVCTAEAAGFERVHLVGYSARRRVESRVRRQAPGAAAKPGIARARVGGERGPRRGRGGPYGVSTTGS